jgi:hypothetical protein
MSTPFFGGKMWWQRLNYRIKYYLHTITRVHGAYRAEREYREAVKLLIDPSLYFPLYFTGQLTLQDLAARPARPLVLQALGHGTPRVVHDPAAPRMEGDL